MGSNEQNKPTEKNRYKLIGTGSRLKLSQGRGLGVGGKMWRVSKNLKNNSNSNNNNNRHR